MDWSYFDSGGEFVAKRCATMRPSAPRRGGGDLGSRGNEGLNRGTAGANAVTGVISGDRAGRPCHRAGACLR